MAGAKGCLNATEKGITGMARNGVKALSSALTLAMIVAATQSEQGFMFANSADAAPFVAEGLAEMNEGVINPDNANEFAVRATAEGINKMNSTTDGATAPIPATTTPGKPVYEIETIEAPEAARRGGGGANLYPFDDLAAPVKVDGQKDKQSAFFVPATAAKPEPWKSLQSAVSAATRRYATQTGERKFTKEDGTEGVRGIYDYTRKFRLSEGAKTINGTEVKGAFVSRVQ